MALVQNVNAINVTGNELIFENNLSKDSEYEL